MPMVRLVDGRADGWWFDSPYADHCHICTAYWGVPRTVPGSHRHEFPSNSEIQDVLNRCGKRWELYVAESDDPGVFRCRKFARWVPELDERVMPKPPPFPASQADLDDFLDRCLAPQPDRAATDVLRNHEQERAEVYELLRRAGYR